MRKRKPPWQKKSSKKKSISRSKKSFRVNSVEVIHKPDAWMYLVMDQRSTLPNETELRFVSACSDEEAVRVGARDGWAFISAQRVIEQTCHHYVDRFVHSVQDLLEPFLKDLYVAGVRRGSSQMGTLQQVSGHKPSLVSTRRLPRRRT